MLSAMPVPPLPAELRNRFLRYLGVDGQLGPPSADGLRALHRAQLDLVPYENIEIQLGRPTTIDPAESVRRIISGRGGYCFHLNGSFGALLAALGYRVELTRGAVPDAGDGSGWGSHMVLLVRVDGDDWIADVGLGDGFRDPVPLAPAELPQPPFRYRLSSVGGPRWRFHHDERATISGFDLDVTPVGVAAFEGMHRRLSSAPESPFVQKLVVQSRRADHTLVLRGCVLTRTDEFGRRQRDVTAPADWFGVLSDEFGIRLDDGDARDTLWRRSRSAHEVWDRAGRP